MRFRKEFLFLFSRLLNSFYVLCRLGGLESRRVDVSTSQTKSSLNIVKVKKFCSVARLKGAVTKTKRYF